MRKSRAYRTTDVKKVDLAAVFGSRAGDPCCVGCDVGKDELKVIVRWGENDFERPWRVANPRDVIWFSRQLKEASVGRRLIVAMEPSGTYGDALRQALTDADVVVHRVRPKASRDYAEVLDGVPSQHDAKDAAVVAELAAIGKSWPWSYEPPNEHEEELVFWVDWLEVHQQEFTRWCGRLESLLARHWPEANETLAISSATLLRTLAHFGGPRPLSEDPQAEAILRRWGGRFLRSETIAALLQGAATTAGVRQTARNLQQMCIYAEQALAARKAVDLATRALSKQGANHPVIAAQAAAVGMATACVLWVYTGDPRDFHCAAAYRKAMGLNLKERSSGRWKGVLRLTKRGPGQVRRWLYFAALRWIHKEPLKRWYQAKKQKDHDRAGRAVVGVMRKLALALYHVGARQAMFDPGRLFPGRQHGGSMKQTV